MHAYESQILTQKGYTEEVNRMQRRLSIDVCFKTGRVTALEPAQRMKWSAKDASTISSLIFGYKLLDACARLSGIYPRTSSPMPRQVEEHVKYLTEVLARVTSWKQVLFDFKEQVILAKSIREQCLSDKGENTSNHQRLLHFAAQMHLVRQKVGFLQNISMAAAHISFLKDANFEPGEVPDIPDDFDRYVKKTGGRQEFDQLDAQFFKHLGGASAGASALRSALQLGLGITPILLIHGSPLTKKGWDRTSLINTSKALGTDKPPLLTEVEDQILRAVFDVAVGITTPFDAVDNLSVSLPWDEIEKVTKDDDAWFILSPPSETSSPPLTESQHTVISGAAIAINACNLWTKSADSHFHLDVQLSSYSQPNLPSLSISPEFPLHDRLAEFINRNGSSQAQKIPFHLSQMTPYVGSSAAISPYLMAPSSVAKPLSQVSLSIRHSSAHDLFLSTADLSLRDLEQQGNLFGSEDFDMDSISADLDAANHISSNEELPMGVDDNELSVGAYSAHVDDGNDETDVDIEMNPTENGENSNEQNEGGKGNTSSEDEESSSSEDEESSSSEDEESSSSEDEESSSSEDEGSDSDMKRTESRSRPSGNQSRKEGRNEVGSQGYLKGPPPKRKSERLSNKPQENVENVKLDKLSNLSVKKPKLKPKPKPKPEQNVNGINLNNTRKHFQDKPGKSNQQTTVEGGDSFQNPIDVDTLFNIGDGPFAPKPEPDLDIKMKPKRFWGTHVVVAHGPRGQKHEFDPEFHFPDTHNDFRGFMKAVENNYVDGGPRHCQKHGGSMSMLAIMTEKEYLAMTPREAQELLAQKHIVMDEASTTRITFDAAGLRTIRPLHIVCSIQGPAIEDTSIPSSAKMEDRIINGTLQQILDSIKDPQGKFLNGLDFPGSNFATPLNSYVADLTAWHYTRGAKGYQATSEYPRAHMRWHLISTGNTVTWVHIDSDGVCSEIIVVCWKKLWIFGGAKRDYSLANIMTFLRDDFYIEVPSESLAWEAVVLTPGTRLLMRPNTLHVVFTPEPTICEGGHFYSTPTMQDTAISLIHSFICNIRITNTGHPPTRMLLRRMAQFFYEGLVDGTVEEDGLEFQHLPKLDTFSGVLNLLSLCNLVILGNALDHRTYSAPGQKPHEKASMTQKMLMDQYDLNDIDVGERLEMIFARGLCVHILMWFEANYEIAHIDGDKRVRNCVSYYLGKQAASIVSYKGLACPQGHDPLIGAPHCTLDMLEAQVENALLVWEGAEKSYHSRHIDRNHLDYGPNATFYRVVKRQKPLYLPEGNEKIFRQLGMTSFDQKYVGMINGGKSKESTTRMTLSSTDDSISIEEQRATKRWRVV
ncbi:hypothetical protein CPB84DRAFT_1853838 [Gymnopilus junonius]|uniref:JmjC domain-containing protein n=1 Tax=Gymnopilus junonius TaxID=109634 RepID=A0A9P5TG91_GYMJU|nr:hypothetical protein CPB84DRAFT_1853838 [Gymnopilus junonius]